jgi:hypothetical protein
MGGLGILFSASRWSDYLAAFLFAGRTVISGDGSREGAILVTPWEPSSRVPPRRSRREVHARGRTKAQRWARRQQRRVAR